MQRAPISTSSGINRYTILKIIIFVVVVGALTYIVHQLTDNPLIPFIFFLFVMFNSLIAMRYYYRPNQNPSINPDRINQEKDTFNKQTNLVDQDPAEREILETKTENCPNCDAEVIPELSFCEECGEQL